MLVEITETRGDALCEILRKEWPYSIHAIYYIKTCLKWKKKCEKLDILLLCSENIESGVFVIINKSGCIVPEITFYALDSHEDELERCLLHVDLNNEFTTARILPKHLPIFDRAMRQKSYKVVSSLTQVLMYMPKHDALKLDTECPSHVKIGKLLPSHLDEIFETWIMKDLHTFDELKNSFIYEEEYALGVFDKQTGVLLSRSLRSHCGVISALQTIPEATGKGYAKLLMKTVTKKLAENSMEPYVFARDFNVVSLSVFRSIGYKKICDTISYIVAKDTSKMNLIDRQ